MSITEGSDSDGLVSRAAAGQAAAVSQLLLVRHDALLRRVIRRMPLDMERRVAPEDVLQDVLADIIRGLGQLEIRTMAGFIAWSNVVADRRVMLVRRAYRAQKRAEGVPPLELAEVDGLLASLAAVSRSPRSRLAHREHLSLVREALDDLDATQRAVIRMRFFEQLSYDQISEKLQKRPGAVRMVAMRTLQYLRSVVGPDQSRS